MVTWTFDLTALLVGIAVGIMLGGLITMFTEFYEGGSYDIGFRDGFDLRQYKEQREKSVQNKDEEQ